MKDKPHILWMHPHFLNWMGGHKYIYEVADRLNQKYTVTIASDKFSEEALKKFAARHIATLQLSGTSTNNSIYWVFLPFFVLYDAIRIRKVINKYSLVISSMFPMNVIATLAGIDHIQLCYEPYAFFYDSNFIAGFSFLNRLFIKFAKAMYSWADVLATRDANVVLTLSDFNKKWIRNIYGRDSAVVYEGVDTAFFKRTRNKNIENKYSKCKIIFHSTDFTKIKGTEYLFTAMPLIKRAVPKIKLLISSTVQNSSGKTHLIKYAEEHNFKDSVEFLGFLPYDLLPAYLSLADVVVQPSVGQSMNLTVKEAMSCSTPVITSPEGVEQFSDGTCGYLVEPQESEELAAKAVKLLKDCNLARKMGDYGVRIVKEKFSWAMVYKKIESEVSKLINERA